MVDREKVIKGLECCLNADANDCEMDCPYFNDCGGFYSNNTAVIADALALLKAQEPVRPSRSGRTGKYWYYCCGSCGQPLDPGDPYCRKCGRAVAWSTHTSE